MDPSKVPPVCPPVPIDASLDATVARAHVTGVPPDVVILDDVSPDVSAVRAAFKPSDVGQTTVEPAGDRRYLELGLRYRPMREPSTHVPYGHLQRNLDESRAKGPSVERGSARPGKARTRRRWNRQGRR